MNVFDFVNAINYNKRDLFEDPQAEKDYVPFIVNRTLSYFPDTILYANEVNRLASTMPKQWQFEFLRGTVSKRQRFSKWAKVPQNSHDLTAVQQTYKYSTEKALEVLSILSQQQLEDLRSQMDKGGKS